MTDAAQTPAEPLRFEHSYTTGTDFPTRFARAYFAYIYTRPARLVPLLVIFAIPVLLAVTNPARVTAWGFPIFLVILFGLTFAVSYFATIRKVRARVPPGSEFGIGFRSKTFVLRSPQVTSEVAYSLYKSCERSGRFVVLRQRVIRVSTLLPADIFTDESLEYLRAQIGLSAPA